MIQNPTTQPSGLHTSSPAPPPSRFVVAVGLALAVWCAAFAAINIWFELTNHFDAGRYADEADALSVANWFVVVLKLVGVTVALLAVRSRLVAPRIVGPMLWAAFATVTVYVVGSIAQVIVILAGIAGDPADLALKSVAYLLAFALAAVGFGTLAISVKRRAALGPGVIVVGALGAPIVLGAVLVVLPAILKAAGLLSDA